MVIDGVPERQDAALIADAPVRTTCFETSSALRKACKA
jgi:hypothetical protein